MMLMCTKTLQERDPRVLTSVDVLDAKASDDVTKVVKSVDAVWPVPASVRFRVYGLGLSRCCLASSCIGEVWFRV
jgi:hypothetical protein